MQARCGVAQIHVDLRAAFASVPHAPLLTAAETAGWPPEARNILSTSLQAGLQLHGTTFFRDVGGHEGCALMPAAFDALFRPIAGARADVYADDAIIGPAEFAAFEARASAVGLSINFGKTIAFNCHPSEAPGVTRRDEPDCLTLGVPIHAGTVSKAERTLGDLVSRLPTLARHTGLSLATQAAEACRFVICTGPREGVQRIDQLLRKAEQLLRCPLPARWQAPAIARLRARTMVEILAKGWSALHPHPGDVWVAEAMAHASTFGLIIKEDGNRTVIERAGTSFDIARLSELLPTEPSANGPTDCVLRALYTLTPRPTLRDDAFDWAVAIQSPIALAAELAAANRGMGVCPMCKKLITADHPTTCLATTSFSVTRTFTHDTILHAIDKLAQRLDLPCTVNCSAPGMRLPGSEANRPDLAVAGRHVELKTLVQDAHARPLEDLMKTVRAARAKYATNGMKNALVLGVTTRGALSPDSSEDLRALNKQFADAAWRPTPDLTTVIGAAIAKAGASRRTIWITNLPQHMATDGANAA